MSIKLHPGIEPYKTHKLKVDNIHTLYIEESGNKNGIPILHIHGGPGSESKPRHRQYYNQSFPMRERWQFENQNDEKGKFRIILYDQRGCGKSTPNGEIKENTFPNLVEDIEKIRKYLKIDKWVVHGDSWGATLAFFYAKKYYTNISSLILRSLFVTDEWGANWGYGTIGAANFFPELYEKILSSIGISINWEKGENIDPKVICNLNNLQNDKFLKAIMEYDNSVLTLYPSKFDTKNIKIEDKTRSSYKILFHYIQNDFFMKKTEMFFDGSEILNNISVNIIHGRYDMACPVVNAIELSKRLPNAKLVISETSGHYGMEKGNLELLMSVLNNIN